jgi:hypothetical protein
MRRQGFGTDAIIGALAEHNKLECDPPLTDEEIVGIARSVSRYTPLDDAGSPFSGKIPPNSQHHLTLAFDRMDISFSYDRFNEQPLITYPASLFDGDTDDPVTQIYDEVFMRRLYFTLERDFFIKTSISILDHFILDKCQDRPFHPVIDYFNTLKWDGVKRIDNWLETYMKAKPENDDIRRYLQAVGVATLLGAVRRIKHPGCKFDSMIVLEGLPNVGKSMSIRALSPNEKWVLEDLSLGTDAKVVIERTNGKWLCEVSELVASRRSEINRIKAFLSLQGDVARKAYGRTTTDKPRQFIFIGTSNEIHYLEDKTGNRKYWPVKCGDVVDFKTLAADRDQLWAEALLREPGAELYLTGDLFKIATEQQSKREAIDDWEDFVLSIVGKKPGWIRTSSIWFRLGKPVGQISSADSRRMGGILSKLGFQSIVRHMKGRYDQARVWIRYAPDNFDPAATAAILDEDRHWESGEEGPIQLGKEPGFI